MRTPSEDELALIKESIRYEEVSGKLFWKKYMNNKATKDKELNMKSCGYYRTGLNGRWYLVHRIVWFLHYNEWPKAHIDHINGIKTDNRIVNLRLASRSLNNQNQDIHRRGQAVGVSYNKRWKKWEARAPYCFLDRNETFNVRLGAFDTMEEAAQAVINFCTRRTP